MSERASTWCFLDKIQCHVAFTKCISPIDVLVSLESPRNRGWGIMDSIIFKWNTTQKKHLPKPFRHASLKKEWIVQDLGFRCNGFKKTMKPPSPPKILVPQTHSLSWSKLAENAKTGIPRRPFQRRDWLDPRPGIEKPKLLIERREKTLTETNVSPKKLGMNTSNTNS